MAPEEIDFSSFESSESGEESKLVSFITKNKVPVALFLIGSILIGCGIFFYKDNPLSGNDKVQVLNATTEGATTEIIVEVAGAVKKPGVYTMRFDSRTSDALTSAGGIAEDADTIWVERTINKAAVLTDGQKIYIPRVNEQSSPLSANFDKSYQTVSSNDSENLQRMVNINTDNQITLETLTGIGPTYARKIIEGRPYSTIEELLSKKVIPQKTFEKIKDKISIY